MSCLCQARRGQGMAVSTVLALPDMGWAQYCLPPCSRVVWLNTHAASGFIAGECESGLFGNSGVAQANIRRGASMIRRDVIMIASISGILGIMMGILGASWVWLQSSATFARTGAVAKTEAGIAAKVELLESLRSGRYNDAARQIERSLDNDLIGAGEFARDGVELSSGTLKAIEVERNARRISGYEPTRSGVSAAVQDAIHSAPHSETGARATPAVLEDDAR